MYLRQDQASSEEVQSRTNLAARLSGEVCRQSVKSGDWGPRNCKMAKKSGAGEEIIGSREKKSASSGRKVVASRTGINYRTHGRDTVMVVVPSPTVFTGKSAV